MSKIAALCSSSKGNSVFVGDNSAGILIDVGCSYKMLKSSLELCGIPFEAIRAVLITHEHIDHVKGLYQLTKNTDLPVYATAGTAEKLISDGRIYNENSLHDSSELSDIPIDVGVKCFHTPHDSAESAGYTLEFPDQRIACCTDLGAVTDEVRENLKGCRAVYIEANYDPLMLRDNPRYPYPTKQRIASSRGHLSNGDCSRFCGELTACGTTRIILGHLSQENNTPQTAYNAVSNTLAQSGMKCGVDYTLDVAPVVTDGRYIIL